MPDKRRRIALPIIAKPRDGSASVLVGAPGLTGPFIRGDGNLDLLCGACARVLAQTVRADTIANMVLLCPTCHEYNAAFSPRTLQALATSALKAQLSAADLAHIQEVVTHTQRTHHAADEGAAELRSALTQYDWLTKYLVPTDPNAFYAMLSCILMLIQLLKPLLGKTKVQPQTVINNYYASADPFKGVRPTDLCPCGSGQEYASCHRSNPA